MKIGDLVRKYNNGRKLEDGRTIIGTSLMSESWGYGKSRRRRVFLLINLSDGSKTVRYN